MLICVSPWKSGKCRHLPITLFRNAYKLDCRNGQLSMKSCFTPSLSNEFQFNNYENDIKSQSYFSFSIYLFTNDMLLIYK
jgi:hypothetical protein